MVIEQQDANEHDMILAFVRAEIDSSRFGRKYEEVLRRLNLARRDLIDNPDLEDAHANTARRRLLVECRGYPNRLLFQGFPDNVYLRRATLEENELVRLKYANHPNWLKLSGGTRSIIDGAKNLDGSNDEKLSQRIRAVVDRVRRGERFPELIVMEGENQDLVLVEGHTRATAYAIVRPSYNIRLLVGSSAQTTEWVFY